MSHGRRPAGEGESQTGFTLIELVIALGLFALIAMAGVALVNSVIGIQGRTAARLDRLDDLTRATLLIDADLTQIAPGPMRGGGAALAFTRTAPGLGGLPASVRYGVSGGRLVRVIGGRAQPLLTGVASARWRFFQDGWNARWPPGADQPDWPRGVELQLVVAGQPPAGVIRRVVTLPSPAPEALQP